MRDPHRAAAAATISALIAGALVACGSDSGGTPDAGDDVDAPPGGAVCGNGVVEDGEDCDDGDQDGDLVCDDACQLSCGNGRLEPGEACDTAIADGDGACPTTCDDGEACTQDVLDGEACLATCINAPITVNADGDGCCVADATSLEDADCPVECGNAVVEEGEQCDTAITAGEAGACPTACADGLSCTTDSLVDEATCEARCEFPDITEALDGDGCCPAGETSLTDDDCPVGCGNGVLEPEGGESCDTGIAAGMPGACPTACAPDGVACTADTLANPGTCTAACVYVPITQPGAADTCCPATGNANNDPDCQPVCGNQVVEAGEDCDDGNDDPNDGCDACESVVVTTAFRFTDLDLRDPHVFVDFIGCRDATDNPVLGIFAVNTELAAAIQQDGDDPPDGLYDLNIALAFRPIDQSAGASTPLDVVFDAECTTASPSVCTPDPAATPIGSTATNMASACLGVLSGTTYGPYTPEIATQTGPCFVSEAETLTIDVSGIPIVLTDARVAAEYPANPAQTLVRGVVRGFISEADADNTLIPEDILVVGGQPLSSLLPGGTGNCAGHSDKDTHEGEVGWWFYLNFTASRATWNQP